MTPMTNKRIDRCNNNDIGKNNDNVNDNNNNNENNNNISIHGEEEDDNKNSPESKKARIEKHIQPRYEFEFCKRLIYTTTSDNNNNNNNKHTILPTSLIENGKTRNDLSKLRKLMDSHGFRTSAIASPRPALSIYKDSCHLQQDNNNNDNGDYNDNNNNNNEHTHEGRIFLVTMLGLNPKQEQLEELYRSCIKNIYCLILFCQRLREVCRGALENNQNFENCLSKIETDCRQAVIVVDDDETCFSSSKQQQQKQKQQQYLAANQFAATVPKIVTDLIQSTVQAEPKHRVEQLEHEYQRILLWNSTFSNALITLFMKIHDCSIKDVYFKQSPQPKYERITIYTYDPELDFRKPPHFLFLPSLKTAMVEGPQAIVKQMIEYCWTQLLRHGYFATPAMKKLLQKELEQFFLSGITHDPKIPLQLNAHFSPNYPLSLYLYGKAGAGKSSFVRNFQPALEATIEEYVDPEILVRFVKQNLNKPMEVLQLELELRPNNNDLSVMSIIQGRRMTMTQTKPGIVLVDLEEMPSNQPHSDPNQLDVSQLISQRFSGRKGNYKTEEAEGTAVAPPRNSQGRGISNDASLVTIFTSNYELDVPCQEALRRLKMFENICTIQMTAVSGDDRIQFAKSYLQQCIKDRYDDDHYNNNENENGLNYQLKLLDIPIGDGDTRPLVRHLRMIAFYICVMIQKIRLDATTTTTKTKTTTTTPMVVADVHVNVVQVGSKCTVQVNKESMELRVGTMENLFPVIPQIFDQRVQTAINILREKEGEEEQEGGGERKQEFQDSLLVELSVIFDFWLSKTLTPAVIVSNDELKIKKVIQALSHIDNDKNDNDGNSIYTIPSVNANTYKMMKSLYDPNDTPNLRDDILKRLGSGHRHRGVSGSARAGAGASASAGGGCFVAVELNCPTKDAQLCIREMIEDSPSMTAFSTSKSALYKSGLLFAVHITDNISPEVFSRASLII